MVKNLIKILVLFWIAIWVMVSQKYNTKRLDFKNQGILKLQKGTIYHKKRHEKIYSMIILSKTPEKNQTW